MTKLGASSCTATGRQRVPQIALGLIVAPRLDCGNMVVASLFFLKKPRRHVLRNLEEHARIRVICTSMKKEVP